MDTYILDHTLQLQSTWIYLKQELQTELFLDLQSKKLCLKDDLISEMNEVKE